MHGAESGLFLTTSITNNTTHKTIIEQRRKLTRPLYSTKLTSKPTNAYFLLLRHHDRRRTGRGGPILLSLVVTASPALTFLPKTIVEENLFFLSKKSVVRAPAQTSRRMWVNGPALGTWGRPFLSPLVGLTKLLVYKLCPSIRLSADDRSDRSGRPADDTACCCWWRIR